jgi:hypothetical protein
MQSDYAHSFVLSRVSDHVPGSSSICIRDVPFPLPKSPSFAPPLAGASRCHDSSNRQCDVYAPLLFVREISAWPVLELSTPPVFVVALRFVSLLIALFALHGLCVVEIDLLLMCVVVIVFAGQFHFFGESFGRTGKEEKWRKSGVNKQHEAWCV